jgi:hypothetical protein
VAPGTGTGTQELGPVAAGVHAVGVQAEGVLGGCNTGALVIWAGTLALTVSGVNAADARVAALNQKVSVSTLGSIRMEGRRYSYVSIDESQ